MAAKLLIWLELAVAAGAIVIAGTKLSHYGDLIARRTGLSGGWIGLVLLATVTSLPELTAGVSAIVLAHAPEVAVGNVLGACVLNFAMIAVLDALHRSASIYSVASQGHALGAGFALLMLGATGFALLLPPGESALIGHVNVVTLLLFVLYAVAIRTIYDYERRPLAQAPVPVTPADAIGLRGLLWRYFIAAAVVVAAAMWLPFIASEIARQMHWTEGFVGTLLVAASTTLPELAVTIAAVRLGALDLAIGNLIGSILFNLVVLGIDDIVYTSGMIAPGTMRRPGWALGSSARTAKRRPSPLISIVSPPCTTALTSFGAASITTAGIRSGLSIASSSASSICCSRACGSSSSSMNDSGPR